jgi:hypothetical protein
MTDPMDIFESILKKFPSLWAFYLKWNFCKGELADGTTKPDTLLFRIFKAVFYLDCSCCAALRGIIFGVALTLVVQFLWRLLLCLL